MCKFSLENKDRLGNAVVYIAEHADTPSKTKLLKLLYLMEEECATRCHIPFLGLPFEVWQAGPVAKDVFIDLSDGPVMLKKFIRVEERDGATFVYPLVDFCDKDFSENELEIMGSVIQKFGHMTAKELVAYTHKRGSLWYKLAKEHNLLQAFSDGDCNSSDLKIDFSDGMAPEVSAFYNEVLDNVKASNYYNL